MKTINTVLIADSAGGRKGYDQDSYYQFDIRKDGDWVTVCNSQKEVLGIWYKPISVTLISRKIEDDYELAK